jgi:hypothetical protein
MQKRRMRGSRRGSVVAIFMVALGLLAVASSAASASVLPNHFPVIRFWSTSSEVTLQIPEPACPVSKPSCEWMLFVDEPDVPAQTVVGVVSGTSGILTVAYPADFCGVIQADAILGPNPSKLEVGHQVVVTTASGCPPITKTTIPPPKPGPGANGVSPPGGTVTATPTGTVTLTNDPAHVAAAEAAQLPFTGIDIKPMGYIGVGMVVTGLLLASTFEKRRRDLRRVKARTDSAAQQAARVSRWFLGE